MIKSESKNIYNVTEYFLFQSTKSAYHNDFSDTNTAAKIQLWCHRNKLHLKYMQIEDSYFKF